MRDSMQDDLDRALDSALATYGAHEPRPGIERRVLARLTPATRSNRWLRWAAAVPVLAGALAVVANWSAPEVRRVEQATAVRPAAPAVRQVEVQRVRPVRHRIAKPRVFPTPASPTREELALMRLAVSNPEVLQYAAVSAERRSEPVTVEPLSIPPLADGGDMED